MAQPLLVGILAGLFTLAASVLALIGVLVNTKTTWKLGKRSGDVQQQAVGVQQQTVDVARIEKLVKETEDLRGEIRQLWDANRQLRHEFEMAEIKHEGERDGWASEKRGLMATIETQRSAGQAQAEKLTWTEGELSRTKAMLDLALLAQAEAEGGMLSARKTIQDMCPPADKTP